MSVQVKIKAQPNQAITFPAICVHCAQPALAKMTVQQRVERATRLIDVPLCASCATELNRQSGEEERLQKISWLLQGVAFVLIGLFSLWQLPAELGWGLRLISGLGITATAVFLLSRWLNRLQRQAALPEKQAIRQAAQLVTFSWKITIFKFTNEIFTERFKQLNQSLLL